MALPRINPQNIAQFECDLGEHIGSDPDLESIIDQYGHGDCHYLADALDNLFPNGQVTFLNSVQNRVPVHSFLVVGEYAVDAYGIRRKEVVVGQWEAIAATHGDSIEVEDNVPYSDLQVQIEGAMDSDGEDAEYAANFLVEKIVAIKN